MVGLLAGGKILQRDQHGRRLAAVADDEEGLVVAVHAVDQGREVPAKLAV